MASNKYEEITKAAVMLFERKGYHATSVQDIADEVGLQKGSLYHYITSKEDLLMQLAHRSISEFNGQMEEILKNASLTNRERLHLAIENHLKYVTKNVQLTTVLLREAFSLGEDQHQVIQDLTDKYLNLWTQVIEQGIAAGEFRPVHARITALSILGSINWVYRWYKEGGKLTASDISKLYSDLFLDGIENR
ncbi:TetR/AcrR family transcriptional regulator [Tumebacillus flagellatus]|uniref:TetR family transcriptional regulator n=1 Tax=Tumebacillus flagellatus TaxID=1157490 RepID=A0A074LKR4_9BACL|nr:TetR/AcrR family transcriptional regulator [Tumebacillus flagellatus]KEO81694.1 TetR family transcriptional regulator [Tumebacillus flagellatus]